MFGMVVMLRAAMASSILIPPKMHFAGSFAD
jgi:hypothetical protein